MKMILKDIKNANATNITNYSFEECKALNKSADLDKIAVSSGVYGVNGALLEDRKTGERYKITSRNSVLFYFV